MEHSQIDGRLRYYDPETRTQAISIAMPVEYTQLTWDERLIDDCRRLVRLAVREDLDREHDWTTLALVPPETKGSGRVVARGDGIIAGMQAAELVCLEMNLQVEWKPEVRDGDRISQGQTIAHFVGDARDLLTGERTILNFLGRLSGIATLTRRYVDATTGTRTRVYDTRKTTPGWRRLEKYAVRCGGGHNHRTGLFDAILIKDNHLALGADLAAGQRFSPAQAVAAARQFAAELKQCGQVDRDLVIEVELDRLNDFEAVLSAGPHIVLLDNMPPPMLREAVLRRDRAALPVELEASGGVRLDTIAAIAATGVERISCGALTHSAVNFDVALDWE
jgi:nicotinate-nucleotide pyrophosphorylase (carboxylating)